MENKVMENENVSALNSKLQQLEKNKEKSKEYLSETQYKIEETKRLVNETLGEINKLKMGNLELSKKCSNLRTQRSCTSKDILEMRTTAERINNVLETASKNAYLTFCDKEEYKNIIEKLEIKKIFIENQLRQKLKASEKELQQKACRVMNEKGIKLANIEELNTQHATISSKVKEIDEKINELTKKKKNNIKECDNIEENIMKIKAENEQLQDCYDNKTKQALQIKNQIREEEEQYQTELAKIQQSTEQLKTRKTLEEKEIYDLNIKFIKLNKQEDEKLTKIEQLNNEHTKLQAELEKHSKIKQELEETMQQTIKGLKNEASIYSQEMQEREKELTLLKEQNLKIEQDQLVFKTQLEAKISESNKMEEELSILQRENQQTEKQIEDMIAENEQIAIKNSDMEKEIDRQKNYKATMKEEGCSLKKQLEEKQKFYTEMMSDYNSKIKEAFGTLDSKKAEEDQRISNYMKEFEKNKKEHSDALAEYELLNEKTFAKTEELENELKLVKNEFRTVSDEINKLLKEKKEITSANVQPAPDKKGDNLHKLRKAPKKRHFLEFSDSTEDDEMEKIMVKPDKRATNRRKVEKKE